MPDHPNSDSSAPQRDPLFPSTMWSAVQAAREGTESEALQALERLAVAYWQPLYVFARQRGADHHNAADMVQGFFEHLLSGDVLKRVDDGRAASAVFCSRCSRTGWRTSMSVPWRRNAAVARLT